MPNKKKSEALSQIQKLIAYASPKEDKGTLSFPVSETERFSFEVKKLLNASEMVSFVEGVTEALFLNDQYTPELFTLVFSKALICYYTDLAISISNKDLVDLVFKTRVIKEIKTEIASSQYAELCEAIQNRIEFKKQELLNRQSMRLEAAVHQIEVLTDAVSKFTEQFKEIDIKQVSEAAVKIADMPGRDIVDNILNIQNESETDDGVPKQIGGQINFFDGRGNPNESEEQTKSI